MCTGNTSSGSSACSITFTDGTAYVDNSGRYELRWDANPYAQLAFVDKATRGVLWAHVTQTAVKEPVRLTLTQLGNVRLVDAYGNLLWNSNTAGVGTRPYCLHIIDGNLLALDSKNGSVWLAPATCPGGPEQRITLGEWTQCGGTQCAPINRDRNLPCEDAPLPYSCCPTGWQCLRAGGPLVWQCQPTRALDMCTLGPKLLPLGSLCGGTSKCGYDGVCGGVCCRDGTYCAREDASRRLCTALPPYTFPPKVDLGTWRYQGPPGASAGAAANLTAAQQPKPGGSGRADLTSPPPAIRVLQPPPASKALAAPPPGAKAAAPTARPPPPAQAAASRPPPPQPPPLRHAPPPVAAPPKAVTPPPLQRKQAATTTQAPPPPSPTPPAPYRRRKPMPAPPPPKAAPPPPAKRKRAAASTRPRAPPPPSPMPPAPNRRRKLRPPSA
jgi:hypothetical protein